MKSLKNIEKWYALTIAEHYFKINNFDKAKEYYHFFIDIYEEEFKNNAKYKDLATLYTSLALCYIAPNEDANKKMHIAKKQ